jgi:hypothetical protein
VTAQAGYWPRSGRLDVQRQRLGSKVYSAINCLQRENKLKKKGEQNVEVQQSCGYIDVLSVTWLAKRESGGRCWPCASWSVTLLLLLQLCKLTVNTYNYLLTVCRPLALPLLPARPTYNIYSLSALPVRPSIVCQGCIVTTNRPANIEALLGQIVG